MKRLALGLALVLAACGTAQAEEAVHVAPVGTVAPLAAPATTTTAAPTTTTTRAAATTSTVATTTVPEATTTTLEPLPTPMVVPADPYAPEPEVVIGRLQIPRLGLDVDLRSGVTLTTLDKGPGHWPGTAEPGHRGNMVIAGHRVTHSKPFRHLDDMVPGDEVIITANDGTVVRYVTTGSEVVDDEALWIADQTDGWTGTLFACHPPGSARQRYVVHLELVR